jgi:molybdopterin/thiamine biosynthesis adenylyltransferase
VPSDEQLGAVLRDLRARGFAPSGSRKGVRRFTGTLDCRGSPVRIELHVGDWDFLSYPPIKVLDGIDRATLAPHINPNGWLCYLQKGSIVLDRYRPEVAVAQCLQQARHVLEQIIFNPAYRARDIQDEFLTHWINGPATQVINVLMGTTKAGAKSTSYWNFKAPTGGWYHMLCDSRDEVVRVAAALDGEAPVDIGRPCWLFRSELPPAVPDQMPGTVRELFVWLRSWDLKVSGQLQALLGTSDWQLQPRASFAIDTHTGWLGFGFDVDPVRAKAAKRKPGAYRQHLHGRGGTLGLQRMWMYELGPEFVHSRNLSFKSLLGKSLAVVGCGAIGSHVAEGLLRLGAGLGGGRLTLVDPERLEPENLGRHTLGYPSLFRPKATALRDELVRKFPLAEVVAHEAAAGDVRTLFKCHLVVDAAGEEALSEQLNARRLASGGGTPVLHTWIIGNGDGVQALWAQGDGHACYHCCLLKSTPNGERQERFRTLVDPPQRRFIGCKAFTPYAVGAPMAAAALALEVVADWLDRGDPSPRFRTRLAARSKSQQVKTQDVTRSTDCPACGEQDAA